MLIKITGPGTFAVEVVGVSRRQDALVAIVEAHGRSGRAVTLDALLILESSNPHDANAVRVEIDGALIGYLSRENAAFYRADLAAANTPDATIQCKARIVGGFETATGERASFGVRLDLPPMESGA
ncbi:MAG: HIRAN domain-containing protein [Alphaproteobacteria bacterium]|nr:HIRAN domain-containing protein [Alphaproteobacteria bacterium]